MDQLILAYYNRKTGVENSYHRKGLGVDLVPISVPLEELSVLAYSYSEIKGIGLYDDGHIHIDLREAERVIWIKKRGKGCEYFSEPVSALESFSPFSASFHSR